MGFSFSRKASIKKDFLRLFGTIDFANNRYCITVLNRTDASRTLSVISKHLRGAPEKAIWGWDNRWTMAYHPATWYFATEQASDQTIDHANKLGTEQTIGQASQ